MDLYIRIDNENYIIERAYNEMPQNEYTYYKLNDEEKELADQYNKFNPETREFMDLMEEEPAKLNIEKRISNEEIDEKLNKIIQYLGIE